MLRIIAVLKLMYVGRSVLISSRSDLANALFATLVAPPNIEFIDTPIAIRDKYQYLTEANMDKVRELGYSKEFTSVEDGVEKYVERLLN